MVHHITPAGAKAALDAWTALFTATSTIDIYDGTVPTDATEAIGAQNVLVTLTYSATAWGAATTASPSVATANAITSGTVGQAGTATFFRSLDNASGVVNQGTVGTSGADMNLDVVAFELGGTVSLTAATASQPTS